MAQTSVKGIQREVSKLITKIGELKPDHPFVVEIKRVSEELQELATSADKVLCFKEIPGFEGPVSRAACQKWLDDFDARITQSKIDAAGLKGKAAAMNL